jgi:hypothetical protein
MQNLYLSRYDFDVIENIRSSTLHLLVQKNGCDLKARQRFSDCLSKLRRLGILVDYSGDQFINESKL